MRILKLQCAVFLLVGAVVLCIGTLFMERGLLTLFASMTALLLAVLGVGLLIPVLADEEADESQDGEP